MELEPFAVLSWRDAEVNAARWLRHWGYADAVARPDGLDGVVDVRATGAVGKVTFPVATVDKPALYNLVDSGSRNPDEQLFYFAAANYAWRAIPYADERRIALFLFAPDGAMTAVNPTAKFVAARHTGATKGAAEDPPALSSDAPRRKAGITNQRWRPRTRRR
jgi:hypothetical protein